MSNYDELGAVVPNVPAGEVLADWTCSYGYSGEWFHLVRSPEGKYLLNSGSHCSCNGPEYEAGSWGPVSAEEVLNELETMYQSTYGWDDPSDKEEIEQLFKKIAEQEGFEETAPKKALGLR